MLVHLLGGADALVDLVEHLAVPDEQDPLGVAGGLGGVGDHEDGLALGVHLVKEAQEAVRGLAVQGPGGLVGQDDAGLGDEGPGHRRALLLAAGDLVGVFFQQVLEAQAAGQGQQQPLHLLEPLPRQHQGQEDVVLDGEGVQEIEVLEHEPQMVPAEGGELPLPDGDYILSVQQHLPAGGLVQSGQDVEQGGLAGAGLPHDGHVFPGLHREVDIDQGMDLLAPEAGGVDLLEVADLQDWHILLPRIIRFADDL